MVVWLVDVVLVDHLAIDEVYHLTVFEVFIVRCESEDGMSLIEFDEKFGHISTYGLKSLIYGGCVCIAQLSLRSSSRSIL